jgi:hypothetical protein
MSSHWIYPKSARSSPTAECRLVVTAIDGDRSGRVLDRGGRLGQSHHLAAAEQPDQPGLVVAG